MTPRKRGEIAGTRIASSAEMRFLANEARQAVRRLLADPLFTAVALFAMALGIGASTAMFSVLDHILVRPLPLPRAERLVLISDVGPTGDDPGVSYAAYRDYADQSAFFESSAAWSPGRVNFQVADEEPQRLLELSASSGFLRTLGLAPVLGRDLRPEDELAGPDSVLISERMWRERFASDPSAIGKSVLVDGGPGTIVGVLPALRVDAKTGRRFGVGLFPDPDLVAAFKLSRVPPMLEHDRSIRFMAMVARLRPGVTKDAAQSALRTLLDNLPGANPATTGWTVQVKSLKEAVIGESRSPLLLLGAALAVLLLACCVNVAGMLLARSSARQREYAVRSALGASRGRIALEVLAEAVVLGVGGGALGFLVAVWSVDALAALGGADLPRLREVRVDVRVAAAGFAIALLAGAASGLWPALQASRVDPGPLLQGGGHTTPGRASTTARAALVIVEIALASLLGISTGLLLRSLERVLEEPPGARPEGLVVMRFGIGPPRYDGNEKVAAFIEALMARVSALAEVESASATSSMPLDPGGSWGDVGFAVDERPSPSGYEERAGGASVMPGFFATMGIPLLRGRDFDTSDRAGTVPVMIVNQAFARQYFPGEDPLGKRVTLHFRRAPDAPFLSREIVGVVGDVHQHRLDEPNLPAVYVSDRQDPTPNIFVVVRTAAPVERIGPLLRAQVRAIDSTLGITKIYALTDALSSSTQGRRFQVTLLGFFAGAALLLAALGVYGVIAYAVVQRTREFGIRLALGATAGDIRRMVLGKTVALSAFGLALGVLGSLALRRVLSAALFGVEPLDPVTYAGVALVLFAVALCAASLPTRRATRLNPVTALKEA